MYRDHASDKSDTAKPAATKTLRMRDVDADVKHSWPELKVVCDSEIGKPSAVRD